MYRYLCVLNLSKILAFADPDIWPPSTQHHAIVSSLRQCMEFTFSYNISPRQGCTNSGRQDAMAPKFSTVLSNFLGFSIRNSLHINLPAINWGGF
jgi:hypothetical protein